MIKSIFILGNHIQALGIARLAKRIKINVHLFNNYSASITRFSNACNRFTLYKNEEELLSILKELANDTKDTILLATNDSFIDFLQTNRKILSEKYFLAIPDSATIDICYNKILTYKKAGELGIPIPESYFPESIEDLKTLADSVSYPILIKPAIMHTFHKATGKKAFVCNFKQQLIEKYKETCTIIPANEIIVQEYLKGGAKELFSFGSFSVDGEVYGSLCANRTRQNPMDFGNSTCYAVTVTNTEFEHQARFFLKEINYFGLSEVEFMYDEDKKEYKLLEINPRAWKWHYIAHKVDINFVEMLVDYFDGKNIIAKHNTKAGVVWIERLTDTYISIKEIVKGKLSILEYLKTLSLPKIYPVWAFSDPLPAIMYLILAPYLFFKRK